MPIYRNSTNHFAYMIRDDVREYKYEERTTRFDRITVSIFDVYHVEFESILLPLRSDQTSAKKRKKSETDRH